MVVVFEIVDWFADPPESKLPFDTVNKLRFAWGGLWDSSNCRLTCVSTYSRSVHETLTASSIFWEPYKAHHQPYNSYKGCQSAPSRSELSWFDNLDMLEKPSSLGVFHRVVAARHWRAPDLCPCVRYELSVRRGTTCMPIILELGAKYLV